MRWVELRRHAHTKKGDGRGRGSHLSQQGVAAARAEGEQLGAVAHVAYVAVSEAPRTLETAVAMGFAVDDVVGIDSVASSGEVGFHEWWEWPDPWAVYRERMDARPALAAHAAGQVDIVRAAVERVTAGATALLVGHGGWIEPTVVAAVDRSTLADWGPPMGHLEGVRLGFDGDRFHVEAVHRLAPPA